MVDVKRRIEKISKAREGRGRLVSVVLGESDAEGEDKDVVIVAEPKPKKKEGETGDANEGEKEKKSEHAHPAEPKTPEVRDIAEMDRRVGELEKLVGSSSTALDEVRSIASRLCAGPFT